MSLNQDRQDHAGHAALWADTHEEVHTETTTR